MTPATIPASPFDPTPARRHALRPLHYAILGLLLEGPAHGYRLHDAFTPGGELGAVLRVEPPTLYAALKELEAARLIEGRESRAGARPPRVEYRLREEGRDAFERWLGEPAERLREVRLDFLLRLYFARRRGPGVVADLVRRQVEALNRYVAALEGWSAALPPGSWVALVADARLAAAQAARQWLESVALATTADEREPEDVERPTHEDG